jgi:hypothetical protein
MDIKVSMEHTVSILNGDMNRVMKWLFKPVARNVVTEDHGKGRRKNPVHNMVSRNCKKKDHSKTSSSAY